METKKAVKHAPKTEKAAVLEKPRNLPELVSEAAYLLFEKSGFIHGNDEKHWLEAEKMIFNRK